MENNAWTLRYSDYRKSLIERLREKLKLAGRKVDTIHGVVTNASVFDHALEALERELDQELHNKDQ